MGTRIVEKGRHKCHEYWPDPEFRFGNKMEFKGKEHDLVNRNEEITVEFVKQLYPDRKEAQESFRIIQLKVRRKSPIEGDNREFLVNHAWFKAWPDHGVPETA